VHVPAWIATLLADKAPQIQAAKGCQDSIMKRLLLSIGTLALLALSYGFSSQDAKPAAAPAKVAPTDAEVISSQKPSYPLDTCPISGEKLGKDAVDVAKDGRLVRVCCKKCVAKVDAAMIKKVDDAVIAAQLRSYPMDTCPVSGEKLDDKAVNAVVGTRLVRACCSKCVTAMAKDSKAAMAKLDKAYIDAQLKTYTLKTCPVSGEELGKMGEPVNHLYGTTLVRFCCKDCVKDLEKDPAAILRKVAAAK
jgi:rRNA maturation protein Nop10